MKFIPTTPSLNGKHEASPTPSGASVIAPQPTVFPSDPPRSSVRTWFYYASRYHLGGAPFLRWVLILLVVMGLVWAVGWLPGQWWGVALCLLSIGALLTTLHYWRRRDFVRFVATTPPTLATKPMEPREKVPVMVTGLFGVEQKYQRFTWLPGFYRTFATREHVLICQVGQKPWAGLGHWPEEEVGLWYIFCQPQDIRQVEWGEIHFGTETRPAIGITHRVTVTKSRRFRTEQIREETVYLAFATAELGEVIWADLQHDFSTSLAQST